MKIYFAGAIRGGREDATFYLEIVTLLRAYGEVLTEHVGAPDLSVLGESKDDRWIHDRDLAWLKEADCLVAEVTTPSLGVGLKLLRRLNGAGGLCVCIARAPVARSRVDCRQRASDSPRISNHSRPPENIRRVLYNPVECSRISNWTGKGTPYAISSLARLGNDHALRVSFARSETEHHRQGPVQLCLGRRSADFTRRRACGVVRVTVNARKRWL